MSSAKQPHGAKVSVAEDCSETMALSGSNGFYFGQSRAPLHALPSTYTAVDARDQESRASALDSMWGDVLGAAPATLLL
jgi:hypothetical protein